MSIGVALLADDEGPGLVEDECEVEGTVELLVEPDGVEVEPSAISPDLPGGNTVNQ